MTLRDFKGFDYYCLYPEVHDYNSKDYSEILLDIVKSQAKNYLTNNLMVTMGRDFHYETVEKNFRNSDKLIESVNSMQNGFTYCTQHLIFI